MTEIFLRCIAWLPVDLDDLHIVDKMHVTIYIVVG